MARVVCIKGGVVVNVIVIDDIDKLSDDAVIGVDENGNFIKKKECDLFVESEVGSFHDRYEHGVGFYRFYGVKERVQEFKGLKDIKVAVVCEGKVRRVLHVRDYMDFPKTIEIDRKVLSKDEVEFYEGEDLEPGDLCLEGKVYKFVGK